MAAAGALGGIAFALYGWIMSKEIPRLVEEKVDERIKEIRDDVNIQFYRQQEAMQKIIASYNVEDPDQKLGILFQAAEIDPSVYNLWNAIAYAFKAKGDYLNAEEYFRKDFEFHPNNYQTACDLVALFAEQEEWLSSLGWMKEAVKMNPDTKDDFLNDKRLENLHKARKKEFEEILGIQD